jgi:probable phosphoglycerate mutase
MTTILFIRHGLNDWVGRALAGRTPGVHLSAQGRAQADALPARLASMTIHAIYSSPLERARETAEPLAAARGLDVRLLVDAVEVGVGDWTGQTFDALDPDPRWRAFNTFRSMTRPPAGELAPEIQARIVRAVERLCADHPGQTVALVSHADVIRAAMAYFAGIPIDLAHRLDIAPASISIVRVFDTAVRILAINDTAGLIE